MTARGASAKPSGLALPALTAAVALALACGAPPSPHAAPAPGGSAAAATSGSASPSAGAAVPPCQRMCDVAVWCGNDRAGCEKRCGGFQRFVTADVVEAMASCVDRPRGPTCDDEARGRVESCAKKSLEAKEGAAGLHIGLFARAWCEGAAACGGGASAGSASSKCVDDAVAKVRATAGPSTAGLYGAFRPEIAESIVACLKGPCADRKPSADEGLGRCIDVVLGEGS